jgi:ketosteroid isomerase-like protein
MTPDEMDKIFADHCAAEFGKDVPAILDTLADDVEHDVVGDPAGVLHDRELIAKRYAAVFAGSTDSSLETLHRYHGEDFFVDDSLYRATITGDFMGIPGRNRQLTVRMLHVCEVREGRISRENVWMDGGAVVAQLSAPD